MNRLASIAAAAMFALALGASTGARADWKIRIDNWGNPDKPDYWKSSSGVAVNLFSTGGIQSFTAGWLPSPTGISGNFDIVVASSRMTLAHAEWIAVGIGDDDMFVIDQVTIYDDNGNVYRTFGVDNMAGWCISTDDLDGTDEATCGPSRRARQWYRFFLHTGHTDPPR